MRASTPTDAAKRVVPDVMEQLALVDEARKRIRERLTYRLASEQQRIDAYKNRPSLTRPGSIVERPQLLVDDAVRRLDVAVRRLTDDASFRIEKLHVSLTALSPQATLNRGYAVVQDDQGHVVSDAALLTVGQKLILTLHKGKASTTVDQTLPAPAEVKKR